VGDAKQVETGLLYLAGIVANDEVAVSAVRDAIECVRRQAAEIKRMRPRDLTIQDLVRIFNEHRRHGRSDWESAVHREIDRPYLISRTKPAIRIWWNDAIAVAEKLLRDGGEGGGA
jgi:hypothetical protein